MLFPKRFRGCIHNRVKMTSGSIAEDTNLREIIEITVKE